MNILNRSFLMSSAAPAALVLRAPEGGEGGGDVGGEGGESGGEAEASLLGGAGGEQTAEEIAAAEAAKNQSPEEKAAAEAAAAEAAKGEGEKEQTDEEKAAAQAALAAPFEGLKAPEGFEALDEELLTQATPLMRAQGIDTPEKAQAFVNAFAPVIASAVEKATTAAATAQSEAISTEVAGWVQASKADKEFGGAAFDANLAVAAKFRDKFFGTDAQKALIREAPIFNHPEVLRGFVAAGKAFAEDAMHQSDQSTQQGPVTLGGSLYGDMKPVPPE